MDQNRRAIVGGVAATGVMLAGSALASSPEPSVEGGRVLGLGGIFLKVADVAAWRKWYADVLGVKFADFGSAMFDQPHKGVTQLTPFSMKSSYFQPSSSPFMINLIVEGIDGLVARAAAHGAPCLGRQDAPYGRFAWLLDPAGVKVELWEPLGDPPRAAG